MYESQLSKYFEKDFMEGNPDLTFEAFASWLGVTPFQLRVMDLVTLESLPNVAELHLIPVGGGRRLGQITFSWEVARDSKHLHRGERFTGRGETYHEAAKRALACCYELITYRRKD